jgi:hypothetical protein
MTIIVQSTASASARDYEWLKASIAGWLHRTDLGAMLPDFVMLAEKRINGDLEARLSNGTTTLITVPGSAEVALPADYAEMRGLSLTGYGPLTYVPLAKLDEPENVRTQAPCSYTVVGRTLRLGPVPDRAYTLSLTYRGEVPALADNGGTNWLIEQSADLYLAAAMCEALTYTRDTVEQQKWEGKYANAVGLLSKYNEWDDAVGLSMPAPSK